MSVLFSWAASEAMINFPGPSLLATYVRSLVLGLAVFVIVIFFSKQCGAIMDVYHMVFVGFCDVCFSRKWSSFPSPWLERLSVIVKVIAFLIAIIIGNFIGPLFAVVAHGGNVMTSDCVLDFQILCLAAPQTNFVITSKAQAMVVLSHMLIIASYFIAWCLVKRKSLWVHVAGNPAVPYAPVIEGDESVELASPEGPSLQAAVTWARMQIDDSWVAPAAVVGGAVFLAMIFTSTYIGVGFDTFFWVATSVYTNQRTQALVYAWGGLMACGIVFFFIAFYHIMVSIAVNHKAKVLKARSEMHAE